MRSAYVDVQEDEYRFHTYCVLITGHVLMALVAILIAVFYNLSRFLRRIFLASEYTMQPWSNLDLMRLFYKLIRVSLSATHFVLLMI